MGVLLRGSAENFNPQLHTEENSLAIKMAKHMEVRKKSIELFKRYSKFTSLMHVSGRTNRGIGEGRVTRAATREMYDNAYRINYEGALILPAVSYGSAVFGSVHEPGVASPDMSGVVGVTYTNGKTVNNIATDTIGSLAIKHDPANNIWGDKFNPNDSIILGAGLGILLVLISTPRKAADGTHYVVDFKTVGPAADFAEAHLAEDLVLTEAGSFFGQASIRGYQRHTKNRWRINYSSIHRYSLTMSGSAIKQKVAWIYNSDSSSRKDVWEFREILKGEEIFHMMGELSLRYSRISMDPAAHAWYENPGTNQLSLNGFNLETGVTPPIIGDGWIPQIKDNATFSYNPNNGLSYLYVQAMMMSLANRSPAGSDGNTFIFLVDKIGAMVMDDSMKKLLGWGNASDPANTASTHIITNVMGDDVKIGFQLKRYNYLNNDVYVMEDELLNNPGLFATNGGVTGSGNIYCINATPTDGVSNFEVIARAGRDFVKKMVDGMHSFDSTAEAGNKASSGFDGCSVHLLKENLPVLYDARSCGILMATAAYNGGALSGSDFITANPSSAGFLF